ncbi:MAG TPA: T9SS type A sorting domain-containing protein [Candidatus Didemnitutus sp.]|nr:T9SS type A sorting domain-containing protein [Candidatus Didemnitutus sp.]
MKHALLVATFAASAVFSVAQQPAAQMSTQGNRIPMALSASDRSLQTSVKPEEQGQGVLFKRVFTTDVRSQFHYWPYGTVSNDMFKYDVKSNTLNIARNKALFNATQEISGVEIGIVRSADNGSTWSFDIIQSTTDIFFGMPVFGWVNPDEGTDPSKYPVMVYGIRYPMPSAAYGGLSMWNRTEAGSYELPMNDQTPPASGYTIQFGDLYSDNTSGSVHWAGTLNPDATTQYGAYGYFNFNLIVEDFGQTPTIPSAWALDHWAPSTGGLGSSFNAPVALDGDDAGTIYAAFNNPTAAEATRSVQVMKSTDQGVTWGAENVMPVSLLDQFAAAHGGDIAFQPGLTPYPGGDFVVFGSDEYSVFYRLATGIRSTTDPNAIDTILTFHIVEANYKAGTWTLNPVAELQTLNFQMIELQDSITTAIGAPAISVDDNGRGHEIQVALTADGNTVVVKWVDINPDTTKIHSFAPIRVFDEQTNGTFTELDPLSSMFDTDIFLTSRPKAGGAYATPSNLTNNSDMEFRTYMPDVVPSANDVPILRILGTGTGTITSLLPKPVAQLIWNGGSSIDFARTGLVSVEDEKNYTFRFGSIAPNPVMSTAEVSFTLDKAASVGIEVYDMLGNQLQTVATQSMFSGMHSVNVDATAFSAGTYHVALVVDGVRIMKPFIVVR